MPAGFARTAAALGKLNPPMSFSRFTPIGLVAIVAVVTMLSPAALLHADTSATGRPNILLIVADDLGYADLGVQGCEDVATPNIDRLAGSGVRFTDGYVTAPVCSPSRAGLLTGRSQQRFGHEFNSGPAQKAPPTFGLPLSEKTVADRLRAGGYHTGLIGKWHLGYREELWPLRRGFDEFFGFIGGAHSYFEAGPESRNPILDGEARVNEIDYTTREFGRRAVTFVEQNRGDPWFLCLAFNAVHTPLQATPEDLARVAHIKDPDRRTFAAMLVAMDDAVGNLLDALERSGQRRKTLVIFLSDNGGPTATNTSSNRPFRGFKGDVWEGGIRVPWVVSWPGSIKPGVSAVPVTSLDVVPTALAAAGLDPDAANEGENLLGLLRDNREFKQRPLCWRFGEQRAVRLGDWKLVDPDGAGWRLFNLRRDPSESEELQTAYPKKCDELAALYRTWNAANVAPAWPSPAKGAD